MDGYLHSVADDLVDGIVPYVFLLQLAAVREMGRHDEALSGTPEFIPYINEAHAEFGVTNDDDFLCNLIRQAQFIYYSRQINNNSEAIVSNALNRHLASEVILIQCQDAETAYELEEKINTFINDYIKNYQLDYNKNCSSVLEDFDSALSQEIDELLDVNKDLSIKRWSDNPNDDDFYYRCLLFPVDEAPKQILIGAGNSLASLQRWVDGNIEAITVTNPYNHNLHYTLILNEEGKYRSDLKRNFDLKYKYFDGYRYDDERAFDYIAGDAILLSQNDETGQWASLSEEEIEFWENQFSAERPISLGSALISMGEAFVFFDDEDEPTRDTERDNHHEHNHNIGDDDGER